MDKKNKYTLKKQEKQSERVDYLTEKEIWIKIWESKEQTLGSLF